MRQDSLEKVLEKLAVTDKTTIVVAKEPDGKMRVTSGSWEGEKVFARDQVLEVRNVDGRLHVARKPRHASGSVGRLGSRIRARRRCAIRQPARDRIRGRIEGVDD